MTEVKLKQHQLEADWESVVGRILQQTKERTIGWRPIESTKSLVQSGLETPHPPEGKIYKEEDVVDHIVYSAQIQGRLVEVFSYRYTHWIDEDHGYPDTAVAIELVGPDGQSWRLPDTRFTWQLIDEIKKQSVQADDFAEKVLALKWDE